MQIARLQTRRQASQLAAAGARYSWRAELSHVQVWRSSDVGGLPVWFTSTLTIGHSVIMPVREREDLVQSWPL